MKKINISEAKIHLCKLVHAAARGQSILITKWGKPVAKLTAYDAPGDKKIRRLGFMEGQFSVPDDFDEMCRDEIERMFETGE